jgi:hypothetical protein
MAKIMADRAATKWVMAWRIATRGRGEIVAAASMVLPVGATLVIPGIVVVIIVVLVILWLL